MRLPIPHLLQRKIFFFPHFFEDLRKICLATCGHSLEATLKNNSVARPDKPTMWFSYCFYKISSFGDFLYHSYKRKIMFFFVKKKTASQVAIILVIRWTRGNGNKNSLSGKTQGIWKFCQTTGKTQGIWFARVVNSLILKVKDISKFATKKFKLDKLATSVLCM